MEELLIYTPFIKLDQALKLSGVVMTGGEAKLAIEQEMVSVNGELCLVRGKKLYPGDIFSVDDGENAFSFCVKKEG